jgi:S1-C subfamily serine protease
MKKGLSLLLLASIFGLNGCTTSEQKTDPVPPVYVVEEKVSDTFETIQNMVVYIYSSNEDEMFEAGSGVVFKEDENSVYVITNKHVVGVLTSYYEDVYENIEVKFYDGTIVDAEYVGSLNELDVAVIKMNKEDCGNYDVATVSTDYKLGDTVIAYGNPLQIPFVISSGIVSNKDSVVDFTANGLGLYYGIQTDASVNAGNSGGGLFDMDGNLIGIVQGGLSNRNGIGYAIPMLYASNVADSIIETGSFELQEYDFDYVDLSDADVEIAPSVKNGVYVTSGDNAGKVITHVNGMYIKDAIRMYMYRYLLDEPATFTYVNVDGSAVE